MKHKRIILIVLFCILAFLVGGTGAWFLYRKNATYVVTQYADDTGLQAMFYTVEKGNDELIVIDGGHAGNAEYVKKMIEERGGHVDAWILTHPHPDHIGAFNVLWNEMANEIDKVYIPDIDYDDYLAKAQPWDEIEYYNTEIDYIQESDKFVPLHRGEEFVEAGLKFKVLSAYDEHIKQFSKDPANDGSLMFKMQAGKESMLFCSDVGAGMADYILQDYSKEIDCDYLQMGHHGNGGLTDEFYKMVTPKAAFFDAPEWLMHPEGESDFITPAKEKLMKELGAEVFSYATAPNSIEIE